MEKKICVYAYVRVCMLLEMECTASCIPGKSFTTELFLQPNLKKN
jgi:hypothetical protein